MSNRLLFSLIASACALLLASAASAQNLLTNGEFDVDLDSWEILNGNFAANWASFDLDASGSSGSARVVSNQPTDGMEFAGSGLVQCLDVAPGSRLDLSGWIYIPSGQGRTALPDVSWVYFEQPACESFLCDKSPCGQGQTAQVIDSDVWTQVESTFVVPLDVQSLRVFLRPRKVQEGGSIAVHFDAVFLPEPSLGSAAAAAAVALAGLARRR